jgi:hypothetical protein
MVPEIHEIGPAVGPTSGGDLVTLRGVFSAGLAVHFGEVAAMIVARREEGGASMLQVRTPAHVEALVGVSVTHFDAAGAPIAGERATLAEAYRYERPRIVREANLTQLVRALLRELKRQVLENVSLSVAVDFDDTALDGLDVRAIAALPSLVVTGPRIKENRFYSTNAIDEELVAGPSGPEVRRRRSPLTVDLEFALTGASDRAVELLNLMSAVSTFLDRNRWLVMDRDAVDPSKGQVRWEMDAAGELQTNLEGKDDVRAFTWGLVIRGFDIDEGLTLDVVKAVAEGGASVGVGPVSGGGA